MSETEQLDDSLAILVLVSGTLKDGQSHYAYVSIPPSKYPAFKQAEAIGNYNLTDYGKILAHGKGKEPPHDVQQRMIDEYGANHRLQEDIDALIANMR